MPKGNPGALPGFLHRRWQAGAAVSVSAQVRQGVGYLQRDRYRRQLPSPCSPSRSLFRQAARNSRQSRALTRRRGSPTPTPPGPISMRCAESSMDIGPAEAGSGRAKKAQAAKLSANRRIEILHEAPRKIIHLRIGGSSLLQPSLLVKIGFDFPVVIQSRMSLRKPGPRPPGFIGPALPSARSLPPSGSNWFTKSSTTAFACWRAEMAHGCAFSPGMVTTGPRRGEPIVTGAARALSLDFSLQTTGPFSQARSKVSLGEG